MKPVLGPPPIAYKIPSPDKTLRRLFLTVFLRGQSARGLTKETAPKSVASKMWLMLLIYGVMGLFSLFFARQPVLALSVYLHAMSFLMLGMFIATSAGESLFNKEESEILMHRPVTSQMLLRAKATVLIQVTLYFAFAMNLVGLFVGLVASDGGWLYPIAHSISTVAEALFCTSVVVLGYQLCLRWFGRERLDSVMTTLQVLVIVCITIGSQILPRAIIMTKGLSTVNLDAWWMKILPPTWFASLDDAIAGSRSGTSWLLAGVGLGVTALILYIAFGRLASIYETGVQTLNESRTLPKKQSQFRLGRKLGESFPLKYFLRDSVSQAGFRLVVAYLFRDRDTKLRIYPGIAPMMIMPVMMLFTSGSFSSSHRELVKQAGAAGSQVLDGFTGFSVALSGAYVCIVPLMALNMLKYSQQYRASDVFIAAPIRGPGPLIHGARVAVTAILCVPLLMVLAIFIGVTQGAAALLLILPGAIAMPAYALVPGLFGDITPLSSPQEEAKSASNFPIMMVSLAGSFGLAGLASVTSAMGLLPYFLILEAIVSVVLCIFINAIVAKSSWRIVD
jgi:hypothetical protein